MELEEKKSILITIDVEDWFQVENFKAYIKFSTWNSFKLRVETNTHIILDLLDSFPFKPRATFFILGWIAKRLPNLVREIQQRGHEVASHGLDHYLCTSLSESDLVQDLTDSRHLLEDLSGSRVKGYRAPSFVINDQIIENIRKAGYAYDSSFNSFSAHGRYGTIDLSNAKQINACYKLLDDFYEIPLSNLCMYNKVIPFGGGGYFRLFPITLFKFGVKKILNRNKAFVFYSHPWEFDPDQPYVKQASRWFKFRHYVNLDKTEQKFKALISSFSDCSFISCDQYIELIRKTN